MAGRRHLVLLALLIIVGSVAAGLPKDLLSGLSAPVLPGGLAVVSNPSDFRSTDTVQTPTSGFETVRPEGTGGARVAGPPPPVPIRRRLNDEGTALVRLGWHRVETGDYAEALRAFEAADRAQPGEGDILLGIGVTHYLRGDGRRAEAPLLRALDADANHTVAHKLLGEIAYRDDDLDSAAARFETVLRLDPTDVNVRERLDRVRREALAQAGFQALQGRHFTVKFAGRENPVFAQDVLGRLETAYQDVGRRLDRFPERKVTVLLYTEQELRAITDAPAWAQGMFDGKIRLPVVGAAMPAESLNKVIRHEYTHALVHVWTRGHVPTWLTEGLAIAFEGSDLQREWDLLRQAGHLLPLHELHGSFLSLPPSQRSLAYAESFAAVQYLLSRYGVRPVRILLTDLGGAKDFDRTFQGAIGLPYSDFQEAFIRSFIDPRGRDG